MGRLALTPVLRIHELSLRRGGTVILESVSWTIHKGEHWAILGANGSGKTSLLSALTGYFMPSSGAIEVLGQQFGRTDWRALRKRIGLVSSSLRQRMADAEPALETVISGKEAIIDFWGKISPRDRRRGLRILNQIECGYLAERPWQVLSQGERQRVLIGRSLMANPPLLILDEPCAGLDPAAREKFLDFIRRLGARPRAPTLVLVTHHVEEIMPVFSHVLLLKHGRVVGAGRKAKVLTSARLSQAFDAPMRVIRRGSRYQLAVGRDGSARRAIA